LGVPLLLLSAAASPAAGYVSVETVGKTGQWSVSDSSAAAALRCTYDDNDLTTLTVTPPTAYSHVRNKRRVGWHFEVLRAKWWMTTPDQWYAAYASPLIKKPATKASPAAFQPGLWTVPAEWQTAYDSFKVRVTLYWYAYNRVTEVGHTTFELEYHETSHLDSPVDPPPVDGPGACAGSFTAPTAPEFDPIAPPLGFPRMSHWKPYWKGITEQGVEALIAELTRMHQTGVILTGLESRNKYALPADVAHYLTMFRDAGIAPYLAIWVSRASQAEADSTIRAWNAGEGQWAGIVLDVERGLEVQAETDREATIQNLAAYMARVRPLTSLLAYSTYQDPSDHPDMLYDEFNSYCDLFMPQLYFRGDPTGVFLLDKLAETVEFESASWPDPPIPIVPVVNDWGDGVDLPELESYIEIALTRYGAVSGWRIHPNMHEEVKDLWGTFSP
jgi:hypothetical protein